MRLDISEQARMHRALLRIHGCCPANGRRGVASADPLGLREHRLFHGAGTSHRTACPRPGLRVRAQDRFPVGHFARFTSAVPAPSGQCGHVQSGHAAPRRHGLCACAGSDAVPGVDPQGPELRRLIHIPACRPPAHRRRRTATPDDRRMARRRPRGAGAGLMGMTRLAQCHANARLAGRRAEPSITRTPRCPSR